MLSIPWARLQWAGPFLAILDSHMGRGIRFCIQVLQPHGPPSRCELMSVPLSKKQVFDPCLGLITPSNLLPCASVPTKWVPWENSVRL